MRRFIALLILGLNIHIASGQTQNENNNLIEDASESLSESLTESSQSDIPEELIKLSGGQVDLNSDEIDLLVIAKLLSNKQAKAIKDYIVKNGKLIEPEELQQIDELDKKTILRILPYSSVYSKKDVSASTQIIVRFQQSLLENENYYNGSLSRILLRFRTTINSSFKAGLTCEKDEGEEMFTKRTPAFDYNSFYIAYDGNKILRKVIAGDFNVECGQGLNAWSGLSFGGSSPVTSIYKYGRGIIPYSGTDENRFFRGIAIALEKNRLHIDTWLSYHPVDANTMIDPVSRDAFATSLQYSGYHRSYSELMDYHSQKEYAAGVHLRYKLSNGEIGIVSSGQHYSIPIRGNGNPYTLFSFKGSTNLNNGFYYFITKKNVILFGEESLCSNGSFATLNGILVSADSKFSYGILYRNYPVDFHNLKSNAFGVNSVNSNEHGLYFALNYTFLKPLTYSASIDVYTFPFLKYKVDAPSRGTDIFHQLEYKPNKKVIMQIRFRERKKQENNSSSSGEYGILADYLFRSLRFSSTIKIDNAWSYGMRFEFISGKSGNITTKGTAISQDLFYHPMGKRYSFNLRYAIFNCPDFTTRIYAYENDVQGAFSVPFYYGNGNRFYTNVNLHIGRRINLSIRYSITTQENATLYNPKSDVKVQMRVTI